MNQMFNIMLIVSTACLSSCYTIYNALCYASDSCTINIKAGRVTFGRPASSYKIQGCSMLPWIFQQHNKDLRTRDNTLPRRSHCCLHEWRAEPFCYLAYQVGSCYMLGGPDQGPSLIGSNMTERLPATVPSKHFF